MKLYHITPSLDIIDELPKREHIYYAFEYTQKNAQFLTIGVVCTSATRVVVRQGPMRISLTKSPTGIWHDSLTREGVFGVNIGGDFFVQAWRHEELLQEVHVAVIPKVFTLEAYRTMQRDGHQMIETFIDAPTRDVLYLKRLQTVLYPLDAFAQLMSSFTAVLDEIIAQPAFILGHQTVKKHVHTMKRWTPKLIIERAVTEKTHLPATMPVQSTAIAEHQIICTMLTNFYTRLEQEAMREAQYVKELDRQAAQLKGNSALLIPLRAQIDEERALLAQRQQTYATLLAQIDMYKTAPLFIGDGLPIGETHLFRMDVKYRTVFELYRTYEQLKPQFAPLMQQFVTSIMTSPALYELWIFFKIVSQFVRWGFDAKACIAQLLTKYPSASDLQGFDEKFSLRHMPFRVRLRYNVYDDNVHMKPDYMIGIEVHGKWQWHTLDAKYKTYHRLNTDILKQDIAHSASRYYEHIQVMGEGVSSSTIIHPNANVTHWHVAPHIAQIAVTPLHRAPLETYFKRLLHEYIGAVNICPTCAHEATHTTKANGVVTYQCGRCAEVWVRSHCWQCGKLGGSLFKYATDNYYVQVKDTWSVHCPTCGCAADRTKHFICIDNVLTERYVAQSETFIQQQITCKNCLGTGYIDEHLCKMCYGTGYFKKWTFHHTYQKP